MSYPCIARDNKKSVTIKSEQLEMIKYLFYTKNWSKVRIAGFFNVEPETIRRNLDPKLKKERDEWQKKYHKKRYAENETLRKKIKKVASDFVRTRYKNDAEFRKI